MFTVLLCLFVSVSNTCMDSGDHFIALPLFCRVAQRLFEHNCSHTSFRLCQSTQELCQRPPLQVGQARVVKPASAQKGWVHTNKMSRTWSSEPRSGSIVWEHARVCCKLQPENWFLPKSSSFFFLKIRLKWKSGCCVDLKKTAALCIFFKTLTSTMSSATSEYARGLLSVLLLQSAHLPASVTVCPVGCVCSSVHSGCWVSRLIEAHCYCVPRGSSLMSPPTHARNSSCIMHGSQPLQPLEFW